MHHHYQKCLLEFSQIDDDDDDCDCDDDDNIRRHWPYCIKTHENIQPNPTITQTHKPTNIQTNNHAYIQPLRYLSWL